METDFFTLISEQFMASIDIGIVILVIAGGYGINKVKKLAKYDKTLKISIIGILLTTIFSFLESVQVGVAIVSFIFAFGFHTIFIKAIEKKFNK